MDPLLVHYYHSTFEIDSVDNEDGYLLHKRSIYNRYVYATKLGWNSYIVRTRTIYTRYMKVTRNVYESNMMLHD